MERCKSVGGRTIDVQKESDTIMRSSSENECNGINPCRCAICQGTDTGTACLSAVTLRPGYGSVHDMETYKVTLCGDCIDWLIKALRGSEKGRELYRNSSRCPLWKG